MSSTTTTTSVGLNIQHFPFTHVFVDGRGEAIVGGNGDLGKLVRLERALELFDLVRTQDAIVEHLEEDVEGGELGGTFVTTGRCEHARSVGACGGQDGACH